MSTKPKSLWPLALLSFVLWSLWATWALTLWPHWGRLPGADVLSRLVAWGVPCAVYLLVVWKERWWFPLGLTFPLGAPQVLRAFLVFVLLASATIIASARSQGVGLADWALAFFRQAQPRWTAPVFEELVFRGVILSELLTWTQEERDRQARRRLRFWGSQLGAAGFFVSLHLPHWVSYAGWTWAAARSLPLFAFALVLGFVFAHTRSIWPCIGLHYLNNEVSLLQLP